LASARTVSRLSRASMNSMVQNVTPASEIAETLNSAA
jgi:hypothetical protein